MEIYNYRPVQPIPQPGDLGVPLILESSRLDLLQEPHGFGCFLFDVEGRLVVDNGIAWLFTTCEEEGGWASWARPFEIETLTAGERRRVLGPRNGEDRAVLHHVFVAAPGVFVGLYCDGAGISAAFADAPDGEFHADPAFRLRPQRGWETQGEQPDEWSLESNGAFVLIERTEESLVFWQGYDSYRRDGRKGDLGWVKLEVDLRRRWVIDRGRHPRNPLPFRPDGWACARCGGNLSSDLRIGGRRAFFFYLRPEPDRLHVGLALSDDPLFFDGVECHMLDGGLDDEVVAEKFQAIGTWDKVDLFYESMAEDGTWRTAVRTYRQSKLSRVTIDPQTGR